MKPKITAIIPVRKNSVRLKKKNFLPFFDKKSLIYTDKEWGTDKKEVIRYWKRIN